MIHLTTENALILAWLGSTIMGGMPQPRQDANYFIIWMHNVAQAIAANPFRMVRPNPTVPVTPAKE